MTKHQSQATPTNATATARVLYMAFELAESNWKIAFSDGRPQARVITMPSRDLERLVDEIAKAKRRLELPEECRVVSCYEAGRDGFWLHRFLESISVENVVVDSASIEVNRRRRRAKTDRLDARKLLSMLIRHYGGEPKVWSVCHVPSAQDEDDRQLHRELEQVKKEVQQHRMRISSLLVAQGVKLPVNKHFLTALAKVTLWDGSPLPGLLQTRLHREYARLQAVQKQERELKAERRELLRKSSSKKIEKVKQLQDLRGIGIEGSWLLTMEFLGWREFENVKQVGGASGLTGTPYNSGGSDREQGISKAGNPRVRWMIVQLAWCWLRFQPDSALSRWFNDRFANGGSRQRRRGIVAVARKLLIALWRYLEQGVVPDGALIKVACGTVNETSIDSVNTTIHRFRLVGALEVQSGFEQETVLLDGALPQSVCYATGEYSIRCSASESTRIGVGEGEALTNEDRPFGSSVNREKDGG